jgi:hypothetical protein
MGDITTAFQLLDLLLFHPGYEQKCSHCGEPMTDLLGNVLLSAMPYMTDRSGLHHTDVLGGECPKWGLEKYRRWQATNNIRKKNAIIDAAIKEFSP